MKRLLLVPAFGLTVLALAAPARAQLPAWADSTRAAYGDDQRASYYDARRVAYDNGYREGLKEGDKDARKREYFSYEDEKTFQRGDKGYHRSLGDRERYRQSFRSGYASGYGDAYQRVSGTYGSAGPYGRSGGRAIPRRPYPSQRPDTYPAPYPNTYPGYPSTYPDRNTGRYGYGYSPAFDNGRRDGYEKGQEDARKNRSFDPLRHKVYRSGDHDYRGEYGPRDQYRDLYRRGFQEGYEQGYRGGYRY